MFQDKIKKAIQIVKRTGDKIILFENDQSQGLVVMSLDEYDKLLANNPSQVRMGDECQNIGSLTEDELIDKINRNIAIWKNENQNKELDEYKIIESFLGELPEEDEDDEGEDNLYYYSYSENEESPSNFDLEQEADKDEDKEDKDKEDEEEVDEDEIGRGRRNNWEIPVTIKRGAEEIEEE